MANCGILFEFVALDDIIYCKILALKYWLRVIQGEQTKLRAICYNYQSRNIDSRCWANEIRKGLEKIGMGWVWEKRGGRGIIKMCWGKFEEDLWTSISRGLWELAKEWSHYHCRKRLNRVWFTGEVRFRMGKIGGMERVEIHWWLWSESMPNVQKLRGRISQIGGLWKFRKFEESDFFRIVFKFLKG